MKSTRANTSPTPTRRSPRSQTSDLPAVNGFNSTSGAQTLPVVVVEEITDGDGDDNDDRRTMKKQKTRFSQVTVEEIDDEDKPTSWEEGIRPSEKYWPATPSDSSSSKLAQPSSNNVSIPNAGTSLKSAFTTKSSAPKEPSKLRFSYPVDKNSSPPSTSDASPTTTSFTPPPAPRFTHAQLPAVSKARENIDPKQAAIAMVMNDLPTYTFPVLSGSVSQPSLFPDAQEAAKAESVTSLPTFDFSAVAKAPPTSTGFNRAVTGLPLLNPPYGGSWECDHCRCKNTADAKDKCAICDSPRSKPTAAPAVKGFDWAAAGVTAPSTASSTWTCKVCMLSNPETASECTVCEATR